MRDGAEGCFADEARIVFDDALKLFVVGTFSAAGLCRHSGFEYDEEHGDD